MPKVINLAWQPLGERSIREHIESDEELDPLTHLFLVFRRVYGQATLAGIFPTKESAEKLAKPLAECGPPLPAIAREEVYVRRCPVNELLEWDQIEIVSSFRCPVLGEEDSKQ